MRSSFDSQSYISDQDLSCICYWVHAAMGGRDGGKEKGRPVGDRTEECEDDDRVPPLDMRDGGRSESRMSGSGSGCQFPWGLSVRA